MGAWRLAVVLAMLIALTHLPVALAAVDTFTVAGADTWTAPPNTYTVTVEAWGAGGGSGAGTVRNGDGGSGGGGGAYSKSVISVSPGNVYDLYVGAGGAEAAAGEDSWFLNSSTVLAKGGGGGANDAGAAGAGGSAASSIGDTTLSGGSGATGTATFGGGGGSSAGNASAGVDSTGQTGATAPTGGGSGGDGGGNGANGNAGLSPAGGAGAGGPRSGGATSGAAGATGQVILTHVANSPPTVDTNLSATPSTLKAGEQVNFTATGSDADGDSISLTVCRTNDFTHGYPASCGGEELCNVTGVSSGNQALCGYTATEFDVGVLTGYGFLCDSGSSSCVSASSASTNVSTSKPRVNSVSASPNPASNGTSVTVQANVTDDDGVSSVYAEISYPNATLWQNLSLSQSGDIWNSTFTGPLAPLGNYTIEIWVNDSNGYVNDSESTHFIPTISLNQDSSITIDGVFSTDWSSVVSISDLLGDAGSEVALDEKGRFLGTTMYPDEELVAVSEDNFYVYEWNATSETYYELASFSAPFGSWVDNAVVANVTPDNAMQILIAGSDDGATEVTKVFNYSDGTISLIDTITASYSTLAVYAGNVDTGTALHEIVVDSFGTPSEVELYRWESGSFVNYRNISRSATNSNYFPFIENIDGFPGDELGLQYLDGTRRYAAYRNDTYANYANSSGLQVTDAGTFWDFNSDGALEAVLGGSAGNITILNSSFDVQADFKAVPGKSQSMGVGDFNGDGCGDLAVGDSSTANAVTIAFWHGNCTTSQFTSAYNITLDNDNLPISIQTMDATDMDGDGLYEAYLYQHNTSATVLFSVRYNETSGSYYQSHRMVLEPITVTDVALTAGDVDSDSVAPSSGGPQYDIKNYSLAHNSSHLFGRLAVNGSLDFSTANYTLYISTNSSTGNSSPSSGALPFVYDYAVVVGSSCTVIDSAGSSAGSCTAANDSSQLEVSVSFSTLGISDGDSFNATWESGTVSERYDLGPDASSFMEYSTASAGGDETAPVISSVSNSSITQTSVVINWTTDEAANSSVEYGQTVSLGIIGNSSGSLVTGHSLSLSGLSAGTTYYYNVTSCDAAANCASDGPYNFTTLSDEILMTSPDNATILDRDGVASDPDQVMLTAQLVSGESGISVTFYANQTVPSLGNTGLELGSNSTNSSGHAVFWWDGTDSGASTLPVGNYTVYAGVSGYRMESIRYVFSKGSWTAAFRYASEQPSGAYTAGQSVPIEAVVDSSGPESRSQLNSSYGISFWANVTDPLGSVTTVPLSAIFS